MKEKYSRVVGVMHICDRVSASWLPVLQFFVSVQSACLGCLITTYITGVSNALVFGSLVQFQIVRRCANILAFFTGILLPRVFCHVVPLKTCHLRGFVRAEVTVISFSGFHNGRFDPLVLGHLVPAQTALLCGHIGALVAGVLSIVLRLLLLRTKTQIAVNVIVHTRLFLYKNLI